MCRAVSEYDTFVAKNSSAVITEGCPEAPAALASVAAQKVKATIKPRVEQVKFNQFVRGLQRGEYAHAGLLLGDTRNGETSESGAETADPIEARRGKLNFTHRHAHGE